MNLQDIKWFAVAIESTPTTNWAKKIFARQRWAPAKTDLAQTNIEGRCSDFMRIATTSLSFKRNQGLAIWLVTDWLIPYWHRSVQPLLGNK